MATRLGDMAVGSTVKIKVDGALKDFIIVQQGSPGAGDNDFDGTWLLMVNCVKLDWIYGKSGFPGTYFDTFVHPYFNGTFLSSLLPSIRSEIRTVHLCNMHGSDVYADCKVFALDEAEVRNISGNIAVLKYFEDGTNISRRISTYNGSAVQWWLRSYAQYKSYRCINNDGSIGDQYFFVDVGYRPAFILNPNLGVASNGIVSTIPGITTDATDLGERNAPFTVAYTATDTGTELLTVTEKLDGEVKQTRTDVAPGTALTVDWLKEKADYQQVLNGAHTITLEVDNGIMSATKTITFTKNVTGAKVSLTAPLTADDTITVAALTLEGSFPADRSLSVEMTNNARDDAPVWENCTDIQRGESRAFAHHAFANKTAAKGAAFNYKVTITRGESGVGGNITMIGGVIG